MEGLRYSVWIRWSEADDAYIAEVPELPGCMADGPTYREALANAEEVMGIWIETATELGRLLPMSVTSSEPRSGGSP